MCTLQGNGFVEVSLPKEGIVAYRLMRLTSDKFMFNPKQRAEAGSREFSSLFTHGKQRRGFTFYTLNKKYRAQNRTVSFDRSLKTVATLKDSAGFYAFNSYKTALYEKNYAWRVDKNVVVVRVRLFGKAVQHMNGWRARNMVVEAVVCGRRPKVEGR